MKRDFSSPPRIEDLSTYVKDITTWWTVMQMPPGKRSGAPSLQYVWKSGPRGIVTFLFGLWCWRLHDQYPAYNTEWNALLEEVTKALDDSVGKRMKRKS